MIVTSGRSSTKTPTPCGFLRYLDISPPSIAAPKVMVHSVTQNTR